MLERLNVVCVVKHIQHRFIVSIRYFAYVVHYLLVLDLSEAVDVYNAWIDACEEQNRD